MKRKQIHTKETAKQTSVRHDVGKEETTFLKERMTKSERLFRCV